MKQQLTVMRSRSATFLFVLACCVLLSLIALSACGNSNTTTTGGSQQTTKRSTSTSASTNTTTTGTTTAQNNNHISLAELIGQPTAKITQGVKFQVTGQVKNMDKLQHNIYLQATLQDASGKVVGIARGLANNVQGGQVDAFAIQGITKASTWATVSVVITKVSDQ